MTEARLDKIDADLQLLIRKMTAFERLQEKVDKIDHRVTELEHSMGFFEEDMTEQKRDTKKNTEATKMQASQIEMLHAKIQTLESKLEEADGYSQRSNLIFEGIPETRNEIPWLKVREVIETKMGIDASQFRIDRCHRLRGAGPGSIKPIIVRFNWFRDRYVVWENRMNLRGSDIYVREDLPEKVERNRRQMIPAFKMARKLDKYSTMIADKLRFKGKVYSIDNLPEELVGSGEVGLGTRIDGDYILFAGRACPYSNFFRSLFPENNIVYSCVEKYYQYIKAKYAGDTKTASAILATEDPTTAKKLGDGVQVDGGWHAGKAKECMIKAVHLKFLHNPSLQKLLKKCRGKKFIECNKYDNFWANGLHIGNKDAGDPSKWNGANVLGTCLNEVMTRIKFND